MLERNELKKSSAETNLS